MFLPWLDLFLNFEKGALSLLNCSDKKVHYDSANWFDWFETISMPLKLKRRVKHHHKLHFRGEVCYLAREFLKIYRCPLYNIQWLYLKIQGRRQLPEIGGGGGGKIKIRGLSWKPALNLIQIFIILELDWEVSVKIRWSKKKKVFAEIRRLFLAKITNFNVFSGQKQVISGKKKGLRRNPKAF